MEKKITSEEVQAFVTEMHNLFTKNADVMQKADKQLSVFDLAGFNTTYDNLDVATLAEIVKAQHIKTNELFGEMQKRHETTLAILRDISNCKDFVAFDDLKKKARSILLAQDMVDRGKSPDEVKTMMGKSLAGTPQSNIILQ